MVNQRNIDYHLIIDSCKNAENLDCWSDREIRKNSKFEYSCFSEDFIIDMVIWLFTVCIVCSRCLHTNIDLFS